MSDFGYVYDKLTDNYNAIGLKISAVCSRLQAEPDNQQLQDFLQTLGEIAVDTISAQIRLTEVYCEADLRDATIERLNEKREVIESSLGLRNTASRKM